MSNLQLYGQFNGAWGFTDAAGISGYGPTGLTRVAASANATIPSTSSLMACAETGAITLTLPAASACPGQYYIVKDEAGLAATDNITLSGTIDGTTNPAINSNYGVMRFYSNGTKFLSW